MAYYIKKPIKIQAVAIERDAVINISNYPEWVKEKYVEGNILFKPNTFKVNSLEGWMESRYDSYLVLGPRNEIYIVQKEIFESTYDKVD